MKSFDVFPITVTNRWQITRLTHTSNRWNGVSITHSFSHLPFARQWVSSFDHHLQYPIDLLNFNSAGYGNIAPSNTIGRMFMIFYALIGIPVNGFLFAYLGDFFGKAVSFLGVNHEQSTQFQCINNYVLLKSVLCSLMSDSPKVVC